LGETQEGARHRPFIDQFLEADEREKHEKEHGICQKIESCT